MLETHLKMQFLDSDIYFAHFKAKLCFKCTIPLRSTALVSSVFSLHIAGAIAKIWLSNDLGYRCANAKHVRWQRAVCSLETCRRSGYSQRHRWPCVSFRFVGCRRWPFQYCTCASPSRWWQWWSPCWGSTSCLQSTSPRRQAWLKILLFLICVANND